MNNLRAGSTILRSILLLTGMTLVLQFTIGCASSQSSGGESASDASSVEMRWILVSMNNAPLTDGVLPTIEFLPEDRVAGRSFVNQFNGSYTIDASTGAMSFGALAMTKMAGPPARMQQETRWAELMSRVNRYALDGPDLTLLDGEQVLLRYRGAAE